VAAPLCLGVGPSVKKARNCLRATAQPSCADIEHHLPAFGLVVAAVKVLTHWRSHLDTRHFPSLCQMIEYFCVFKDIQNLNYL
jgi:hypothetical protein